MRKELKEIERQLIKNCMRNTMTISEIKDKEMLRLCGDVPETVIQGLKRDMSEYIRAYDTMFRALELTFPPEFDHHGFRERHNYIELQGNMRQTVDLGFQGAEWIMDDIHHSGTPSDAPVTSLLPPVILNDLVVRTVKKGADGKNEQHFDVHSFDPGKGLMCISCYTHVKAQTEQKTVTRTVLDRASAPSVQEVVIPAHLELLVSAIIPISWVIGMYAVGMHSQWKDLSFRDYPVLMAFFQDRPYARYSRFYQESLHKDDAHGVLQEALDASFGFQRYLIKLTEDREKVEIKKPTPVAEGHNKDSGNREEGKQARRSVINLDGKISVFVNDSGALKQFRQIKKCGFRFSVRGHYRHYRNGKKVWIKTYDKNRDKPARAHEYTLE